MAHGGSLTINPETGLPEAGFLSGHSSLWLLALHLLLRALVRPWLR
jgi:hypothetical protein